MAWGQIGKEKKQVKKEQLYLFGLEKFLFTNPALSFNGVKIVRSVASLEPILGKDNMKYSYTLVNMEDFFYIRIL